jgi:hypothetical protein
VTWKTIFSMPLSLKRRVLLLATAFELYNTNEQPEYIYEQGEMLGFNGKAVAWLFCKIDKRIGIIRT